MLCHIVLYIVYSKGSSMNTTVLKCSVTLLKCSVKYVLALMY